MKARLYVWLLAVLGVWTAAWGQTETTLCYPDGTVWEEALLYDDDDKVNPDFYVKYRYLVTGDTLINERTYKRVERKWLEGLDGLDEFTCDAAYALREEDGQVYIYGHNDPEDALSDFGRIYYDGNETLRYNFKWVKDGPNPLGYGTLGEVSQVVLDDGKTYDYAMDDSYKVIRTIGATRHGLLFSWNWGRNAQWFRLTRFSRNGVDIYHLDYQQPNGITTTKVTDRPQPIYTLQGIQTGLGWQDLPRGIYIMGGKKRIK